jgi:iron complex outermembrane receptor protein
MIILFVKICFLLILAGSSSIYPDNGYSVIKGNVYDSDSRLPIANAKILIAESDYAAISNSDGSFLIDSIPNGNYILKISSIGFYSDSLYIYPNKDTVLTLNIYLTPSGFRTPVITVIDQHPQSILEKLLEKSSVLKNSKLNKLLGQTVAITLKNQPGLSVRSMGPAPSNPIFRGLSGSRVLIAEDGIASYDLSSSSPDHSLTIEPFTIQKIDIIRGPKILLNTPNSLSALINIVRNNIPQYVPEKINLTLGGYAEYVNKGFLGSAVISVPLKFFAFKADGSYRNTNNFKSPIGEIKNTYSKTNSFNTGTSWINSRGYAGFSFREFNSDYGIPGGFIGSHPNGVNINMTKRLYSFKMHYKFKHNFFDHFDFELSRTYYKHTEFEAKNIIGSEFKVINYNGYFNIFHNNLFLFSNGIAGLSFENKDFSIGGFVFSPPSKALNISLYVFEEFKSLNKFRIEISARYDFSRIKPNQVVKLANLDTIFTRNFNLFSASISAVFKMNKSINAGIILSKSSRTPSIEELFSDGPHLAAYSYEIGSPNLSSESGIGLEPFVFFNSKNTYFMFAAFYNYFFSFIANRNTGKINYATLLPVYQSQNTKAEFVGFDSQFEQNISKYFKFSSSFSFVNAINLETKSPLPQIPPAKGNTEISYTNKFFSAGLNSEFALSQNKTDQFETSTPAYLIFGAFAQLNFNYAKLNHFITLNIENLTNKTYYNHLNRIKSIQPEPGLNFRIVYKLYY